MADIFRNARLKVKRANSHIDEIISDSTPFSKDLYEITNGPGRSVALLAKPDGFYLTYRPKEPIVEYFGAIIGDAVNNLREALEYWINAAVTLVGPRRKLYFPFSKEWKDLKFSPNYPAIEKAFPDLADFLWKNIQPCRDTNLDLWAATSLCNFNKHNDFVPVVTIATVENINARIGTNIMKNGTIGGNANSPIRMMRSDIPIAIDQNFRTSVEITFPKGAIFEDQPVVPTLMNMSHVVTQTLKALDKFIVPFRK